MWWLCCEGNESFLPTNNLNEITLSWTCKHANAFIPLFHSSVLFQINRSHCASLPHSSQRFLLHSRRLCVAWNRLRFIFFFTRTESNLHTRNKKEENWKGTREETKKNRKKTIEKQLYNATRSLKSIILINFRQLFFSFQLHFNITFHRFLFLIWLDLICAKVYRCDYIEQECLINRERERERRWEREMRRTMSFILRIPLCWHTDCAFHFLVARG